MDIPSLLGMLAGLTMVLGAIYSHSAGNLGMYWDPFALMIVLGGTLASIFVAFPFEEVRQAFHAAFKVFASRKVRVREVVGTMVKIAEISRREGIVALENVKTENPVLKKACQLIADNADPQLIRTTLAIEINTLKRRHKIAHDVFKRLGSLTPAYGMMGTLIGLVQMLSQLNSPENIGPAMAMALLTTLYGSVFSTMIFLPMGAKLQARTLQEQLQLEIVFEGAKCILVNNNPTLVYEKLSSFLPPSERK